MYKLVSVTLLGFFALLIFPFNFSPEESEQKFYGAATIVLHDEQGKETFQQTIHNRLVDTGENFILKQTFQTTSLETSDAKLVGTICITDYVDVNTYDESTIAGDFDGNNGILLAKECKQDLGVDIATDGKAIIGPISFVSGTNLQTAQYVRGIGICQSNSGSADFANCGSGGDGTGILFAVIDTSDVQVQGTETVDITYTFDITSDST